MNINYIYEIIKKIYNKTHWNYYKTILSEIKIKNNFSLLKEPTQLVCIKFYNEHKLVDNKLYWSFEIKPLKKAYYIRKLILSKKQLTLFINNLFMEEKSPYEYNKDITHVFSDLSYTKENNNFIIYLHFWDDENHENHENHENMTTYQNLLLTNIEVFRFYYYQNKNSFCSYFKNSNNDIDIKKSINNFTDFINFYKKIPLNIREKIIIFSGMILHSLGTTYTKDIDILIVSPNESVKNDLLKYKNILNKFANIEYYIQFNDNEWYNNEGKCFLHCKYILNTYLPEKSGAADISEIIGNPEHHFYFLGIKMVSIDFTINRLKKRNRASAYCDLLNLERINNYDVGKLCIINYNSAYNKVINPLWNRQDKIRLHVKSLFNDWFKIDLSLKFLEKRIPTCFINSLDVFKSKNIENNNLIINSYINIFYLIYKKIIKKINNNNIINISVGNTKILEYLSNKKNTVNNILLTNLLDNKTNLKSIQNYDIITFFQGIENNFPSIFLKLQYIKSKYFYITKINDNVKLNEKNEVSFEHEYLSLIKFVYNDKYMFEYCIGMFGLQHGYTYKYYDDNELINLFKSQKYECIKNISFQDIYGKKNKFQEILKCYSLFIFQKEGL
jgi:hypothetical protein